MRTLLTTLAIGTLLATGPTVLAAKRMHLRQKSACTQFLLHLSHSPDDILDSNILTIDQGPLPGEKLLTLGHPETNRLYQGTFRPFAEGEKEAYSPQNELAAFLIDQLLGRPANVPLALEYTLRESKGVFHLKVQKHPPNQTRKIKRNLKEEWATAFVFDFIIGLERRNPQTIKRTPEGFSLTEHLHAFTTNETATKELKTAWKLLSQTFKAQLQALDEDALKDELEGVLSDRKITETLRRIQILTLLRD